MDLSIHLVRCHPDAVLPKMEAGNVGLDVSAVQSGRIFPGETVPVPIGWKLAETLVSRSQVGYCTPYLKIEARSGLALKSVFPVGGIIDPSYRGEIKVLLHNGRMNVTGDPNKVSYDFSVGDRIAQLVIYPVFSNCLFAQNVEVLEVENIVPSERGESGFGSSGR